MAKEKKKGNKNNVQKKDTISQIVEELKNIRTAQRSIIEKYQMNLEGDIAWCIETLSSDQKEDQPGILSDEKELESLLAAVQALKLKPHKGRLKDIRKINDLVNEIYAKLID